jgi:starch synthase
VLCAGAPDGPEIAAEVKRLVSNLQTTRSSVVWIEEHLPQPELATILSHSSLFVCPSIYEPLGIVNLEAMACGVPVVGTATGGIPEVVIDGETGWLVPVAQLQDGTGTPIDEERFVRDWAETLVSALESDDLQRRGELGRKRAEQHFAWDSIAKQTRDVYQLALG